MRGVCCRSVHVAERNHPVSVFIIAEAGVNHNGSQDAARQLIDVAVDAGADAVKFQMFKAGKVVSRYAPKADYQERTTEATESQFAMLEKLELTEQAHRDLYAYACSKGIEFLSTPFDAQSLNFLAHDLGLPTIKVPSGEITNAPFLLLVAQTRCRIILSTGMSTLEEVREALGVLAFGASMPAGAAPGRQAFENAYDDEDGRRRLHERVTLLHCTTEYPAPLEGVNLKAMNAMAEEFNLPVGYSDHTLGIHVPIAAVARGAVVIEKHFTLDRTMPGPDHHASLEPEELRNMVQAIREVELVLGDGIKRPASVEYKNRDVVRRSLTAARNIAKGERFSSENIDCKRPGTGLSPLDYWEWLGRFAERDYEADEMIMP